MEGLTTLVWSVPPFTTHISKNSKILLRKQPSAHHLIFILFSRQPENFFQWTHFLRLLFVKSETEQSLSWMIFENPPSHKFLFDTDYSTLSLTTQLKTLFRTFLQHFTCKVLNHGTFHRMSLRYQNPGELFKNPVHYSPRKNSTNRLNCFQNLL